MPRPKKGSKGYEEASRKWRAAMLEKFGSEEELSKHFSNMGRKGGLAGRGKNYGGGFSSEKTGEDGLTGYERAKVSGQKGGRNSKIGYKLIGQTEDELIYIKRATGEKVTFPK